MELKHISIFLLMLGFLFFGCTSTSPEAPPSDETQESSSVQDAASADEEDSEGTTGSETSGTHDDSSAEDSESIFGTKACYGVISMGLPAKCTMIEESQGETNTVVFYTHGRDKMRFEVPPEGDYPCQTVVIYNQGNTYIGCKEGKYLDTSCDWFMAGSYEDQQDTSGQTTSQTQMESDYFSTMEDMPRAECYCEPWVPNDSSFEISGKICDQEDLMQEMMAGMQ